MDNRPTPARATPALRLMARLYRSDSESPEYAVLVQAIQELDRLYRVELIAEHAWCTKSVDILDEVFGDGRGDCLGWQKPKEEAE